MTPWAYCGTLLCSSLLHPPTYPCRTDHVRVTSKDLGLDYKTTFDVHNSFEVRPYGWQWLVL